MGIIDNAKEIAGLVKKIGDIELYRKIVELEGQIIELTREKRELEENLKNQNQSNEIIKELSFDAPFYVKGIGSELFCARCIEADHLPIHLMQTSKIESTRRLYECPKCKTQYPDRRKNRDK